MSTNGHQISVKLKGQIAEALNASAREDRKALEALLYRIMWTATQDENTGVIAMTTLALSIFGMKPKLPSARERRERLGLNTLSRDEEEANLMHNMSQLPGDDHDSADREQKRHKRITWFDGDNG